MADTSKTDSTPQQAEPVVISAQNIKNAQMEKIEKERKDLIQKQLKQGVVDDKNSKNLVKTLTQIGAVLKGLVPNKNKQPGVVGKPGIESPENDKSIKSVIKGALSDVVKGKTDGLKSMLTTKGIVGLAAAKYAGDPNSIMGSVFSRVHEHLDDKDKAKQAEQDHFKGYTQGTDIGREQYQKTYDKKKVESLAAGKKLSEAELHAETEKDTDLQAHVKTVYDERKKKEAEIETLKTKAATLKSQGGAVKGGKAAFTLSAEEIKRLETLEKEVALVARGVLAVKETKPPVNVPKTDIDHAAVAEADERDKAMDIFRKNNNITDEITPQQEKQFEHELKQNKEAKIRARDENNKIQLANESVKQAMDDGAFEKIKPEIAAQAGVDVNHEDIEKARETFYSDMFKDMMDELNNLSKDQLEELHAIRTAIENDNKNDSKREGKQDQSAKDSENKIQKLDSEGPDLIKQNTLLEGKPIVEKSDKKSGAPEKDEKSGGILDQLTDFLDPKKGKPGGIKKAAGGILSKAGGLLSKIALPATLAMGAYHGISDGIDGKRTENAEDIIPEGWDKIDPSKWIGNAANWAGTKVANLTSDFNVGIDDPMEKMAKAEAERAKNKPVPPPEKVKTPEIAPEKPQVTPTKEIIDEKQDAVDQAREEKKTPPPSIVNAPTVNNKTTNNNTTITREPIRPEDPNLPWRSAIFSG